MPKDRTARSALIARKLDWRSWRGSSSRALAPVLPDRTPSRVRVTVFRVLAALAGLFFVVAVVLAASAPWVLLQPSDELHPELHRWFLAVAGAVDGIAAGALLVTAAIALPRQVGGTDLAARAGWWSDYAEHATVLAVAGVLAASRGPGWRILRPLCGAVWIYLGLVAAVVLPHELWSWGRAGGVAALLVGVAFGAASWRGDHARIPARPRSSRG
jgi:hypothetical protein